MNRTARSPSVIEFEDGLVRAIVESVLELVLVLERDGRILYATPSCGEILGYEPDELVGMNGLELLDADDGPEEQRRLVRARVGERVGPVRLRARRRGGDPIWLEAYARPVPTGPGHAGPVIVSARDVTERMVVRRAAEENAIKYRSLVEHLPAITYMNAVDLEARPLYVSPQMQQMLGYSLANWLEDPAFVEKVTHPDDLDAVLAGIVRCQQAGEPFEQDYRMISETGDVVWVHDRMTLVRDDEGRPLFWQGVALDITRRKRAEEALRENEARFRAFFEHSAGGQGLTDGDGRFLQVNRSFARMLGYEAGELAGVNVLDVTHPDDRTQSRATIARLASGTEEDHSTLEKRYLRKDGTAMDAITSVAAIRDASRRVVGFLSQVQDITERTRAERALALADRQRRALLASLVSAQESERKRIAIDIHDDAVQKITAASIRLESLERSHPELREDPRLHRAQEAVRTSISSLRRLMFDLRPYVLDKEGLVATLRSYLAQQSQLEDGPKYELVSRIAVEPPRDIRVVLFRIAQEALANARRHAHASLVLVELGERDGGWTLRVDDDGVGISGDVTCSPDGHVGLTSMRERAELAGGTLHVTGRPGKGTVVEAWVPDALYPRSARS